MKKNTLYYDKAFSILLCVYVCIYFVVVYLFVFAMICAYLCINITNMRYACILDQSGALSFTAPGLTLRVDANLKKVTDKSEVL